MAKFVTASVSTLPAGILYKSIEGHYQPVSYPDGPITACFRFIKNAYWAACYASKIFSFALYCSSGPSCSKLTMLLVNDSLKFTSSDTQIC